MIIHPAPQGTDEWRQARAGIPTSSQFHKIITPTGKPSSQSTDYLYRLLAERALGMPLDEDVSQFMLRGTALEREAVAWYVFKKDVEAHTVGLCMTDNGHAGCSPDRLVGRALPGYDAGLEIKCPSAGVHMAYLMEGPDEIAAKYRPQIQGCLWITGLKRWDVLSYSPALPCALTSVERDEKYILQLEEEVERFCVQLEGLWERYEEVHGSELAPQGG